MQQKDTNNPNRSLLSRMIVIVLISIVIVVTIIAGKKATTKQSSKSQSSTPQVITPTPSTPQEVIAIEEERCFITLNSKRYEVSDFRNEHEGGNIFICGTDMTEEFKGEHKNDFARVEEYEVDDQGNFKNK